MINNKKINSPTVGVIWKQGLNQYKTVNGFFHATDQIQRQLQKPVCIRQYSG